MSKRNIYFLFLLANWSLFAQNAADPIGIINGQRFSWGDFLHYEQTIYAAADLNQYQLRAHIWDYFVESALIRQEATRIGLGVPEEEMNDLQFGYSLSPIIRERFRDETGQVNYAILQNIQLAINTGNFPPEYQDYWTLQAAEIEKERLQSKMTALLTKGCYTPAWLAETAYREANEKADLQFVRIPFSKIPDEASLPSDADWTAFQEEYARFYYQPEELRVLDFLLFSLIPSASDTATVLRELTDLIPAFKKATNDSLFATGHGGTAASDYFKAAELPSAVAQQLLRARPGTVVGPFTDGETWSIVKVLDRMIVPDSVRSRHLLLRNDDPAAEQQIDAWLSQLRAGKVDFADLAHEHSQDPGSGRRGGDLGWAGLGTFVSEFNALCFYIGKPGRFYKVKTQFGWHLVEITGRKFLTKKPAVRLAVISRSVLTSPPVEAQVAERASTLQEQAGDLKTLRQLAQQQGLNLMSSDPLKASDFMLIDTNLSYRKGRFIAPARDMIREAFSADRKAGDLLPSLYTLTLPEKPGVAAWFGISGVQQIIPRGPLPIATLRNFPGAQAQLVRRKKAAAIAAKTRPGDQLSAIATQWGVPVESGTCRFYDDRIRPSIDLVRPAAAIMPGVTFEYTTNSVSAYQPAANRVWRYAGSGSFAVVGRAFALANTELSGPLTGHDGVYFLQKTGSSGVSRPADLSMFRRQSSSAAVAAIRPNWLREMKNRANIEDFRGRFY